MGLCLSVPCHTPYTPTSHRAGISSPTVDEQTLRAKQVRVVLRRHTQEEGTRYDVIENSLTTRSNQMGPVPCAG